VRSGDVVRDYCFSDETGLILAKKKKKKKKKKKNEYILYSRTGQTSLYNITYSGAVYLFNFFIFYIGNRLPI
jgi:hypothetical protein